MDRLAPESDERFAEVLAENARSGRWQGLILTGSEITLRRDLPELAQRARGAGFRHVRIQTHGMHLDREDFTRGLVAAGVDEYFVSVAGSDAETHDSITTIPGSFKRMMCGLEMLDKIDGVTLISNTVVTTRSYRLLPAVVERLSHLRRLAQMEFWVYWPMSETDDKDLVASHREVAPYLRRAAALAKSLGRDGRDQEFPRMSACRGWRAARQRSAAAPHRPCILVGIHAQRLQPMRLSRPLRLEAVSRAEHGLCREVRFRGGRAFAAFPLRGKTRTANGMTISDCKSFSRKCIPLCRAIVKQCIK